MDRKAQIKTYLAVVNIARANYVQNPNDINKAAFDYAWRDLMTLLRLHSQGQLNERN